MTDNLERTQWQTILAEVEKDLAEHERKILELKGVRNYFRKKLGLPIEEKVGASAVPAVIETHTGTLPMFRKGDFFGLSQAEAGHKVLGRAGGSLTTDEILRVLQESGYEVGGQDPKRTLYVSLCRSRKLVLVASNTFDLAERRPKPRRLQRESKEEEETKRVEFKRGKVKKEKTQSEEQSRTVPEGREEKESD